MYTVSAGSGAATGRVGIKARTAIHETATIGPFRMIRSLCYAAQFLVMAIVAGCASSPEHSASNIVTEEFRVRSRPLS